MRVFIESITVNSMDIRNGDGEIIDICVINATIKASILDGIGNVHYIKTNTTEDIKSFADAERVIRRIMG